MQIVTALQLCQLDLDYKAQIIQKQHFEIEKLNRVNDYLLRDKVNKQVLPSIISPKTDTIILDQINLDGL